MMRLIKTLLRVVLCLSALLVAADDAVPPADEVSGDVHWSLRPLPETHRLESTSGTQAADSARHPIDRYISQGLQEKNLSLAEPAASHLQVRRLSFMLTGLPPDASVVQEFVRHPTDDRYAALVDRYLNSPQFGERWARHWLDVVRYAETWGYEWNHLIRGAWRYRDYLIRAFNQDLPYDQLIREHIAGDLLVNPRVNEALGINESLIGGAFYRFAETGHDDCVLYPEISLDVMDNQIDTLSKAFQALTVSCSRCHDHKLDAISQEDYYGLLGIMASSRQVIHTLDLPRRQDELKAKLAEAKGHIRLELANLWNRQAQDLSIERMRQILHSLRRQEDEVATEEEKLSDALGRQEHPLYVWQTMTRRADLNEWRDRWAQTQQSISAEHQRRVLFNREHYVLFGDFTIEINERREWALAGLSAEEGDCFVTAGDFSVSPRGPRAINGVLPAGLYTHRLSQKLNAAVRSPLLPEKKNYVTYQAMGERHSVCRTVIANCTLPYFHSHRFSSPKLDWTTVDLRHIRSSPLAPLQSYLEWTTALDDQGYPVLQSPHSDYQEMLENPRSYFGITKVFIHDIDQQPLEELHGPMQLFEVPVSNPQDLLQCYQRLLRSAIVRWSGDAATATDVYWLNSFLDLQLLSREHSASTTLARLVAEYRTLEEKIQTPQRIVGMADQDQGFDAPLLLGGDATSPGNRVKRSYLTLIENAVSSPLERTGSGRQRVAELIAHPDNPLTARVMANRIWHYTMGSGIVRSVDNFGKLGEPPSHPELLDYLARRLIDSGWSLKTLIREIVLSESFRQSSIVSLQGEQRDPENRLHHRYPSRRLEAEVIRDSLLAASGRLDHTMFGPSIDPYRQEEIDLRRLYAGPLDGEGRRSIYLKVTRMGLSKLLELFDFPDTSVTRGRRDLSNLPAQALGLMNHPFVHLQAAAHAKRLLNETQPDTTFESLLERLFLELFTRKPDDDELREYVAFFHRLAALHDLTTTGAAIQSADVWKDLIHTLYNLKEFCYVL